MGVLIGQLIGAQICTRGMAYRYPAEAAVHADPEREVSKTGCDRGMHNSQATVYTRNTMGGLADYAKT